MKTRSPKPRIFDRPTAIVLASACFLGLLWSGCGDDNGGNNPPPTSTAVATSVPTATAAPTDTAAPPPSTTPTETPTEAATATPTSTPLVDVHMELFVGSTQAGGGQLTTDFDFSKALPLFLNECLDGVGDQCTGGTALYTSVNPGIEPLEESDPGASLYVLDEGTPVSIEIISIDSPLSMRFEDVTFHRRATPPTWG